MLNNISLSLVLLLQSATYKLEFNSLPFHLPNSLKFPLVSTIHMTYFFVLSKTMFDFTKKMIIIFALYCAVYKRREFD